MHDRNEAEEEFRSFKLQLSKDPVVLGMSSEEYLDEILVGYQWQQFPIMRDFLMIARLALPSNPGMIFLQICAFSSTGFFER